MDGLLHPNQISIACNQVNDLKNKGVQFEIVDEIEAARLLTERTHYWKIHSFLDSFDKWSSPSGDVGKYLNLDFGYLCELAKLDARLRYVILGASLDLEHFIKVRINAEIIRRNLPNGACEAVDAYLDFTAHRKRLELDSRLNAASFHHAVKDINRLRADRFEDQVDKVLNSADIIYDLTCGIDPNHIERSFRYLSDSVYTKHMVNEWRKNERMDLGKFIEMVSFGDLIGFFKFFFLEYLDPKDSAINEIRGLLFPAKTLRNAAAHNDVLLHCAKETLPKPNGRIAKALKNEYQMPEQIIDNSKKIPLMHDLSALFICYDRIVVGSGTRQRLASKLADIRPAIDTADSHMRSHDRLHSLLCGISALCATFERAYW